MTTISALADELADLYDTDHSAMLAAVNAYADQMADDPNCFDFDARILTDEGAEVIRMQIASTQPADVDTSTQDALAELGEAQEDVDRQDERLARRDAAVRTALSMNISVQEIANVSGLSRERVYQIRDGRR